MATGGYGCSGSLTIWDESYVTGRSDSDGDGPVRRGIYGQAGSVYGDGRRVLDMGETMAAVPDRDTLTEILKRRRRFQRAFRRHLWKSVPHRGRQIEKCRLMYAKRRMRFGRMIYNAIQSAFDEVVFGVG